MEQKNLGAASHSVQSMSSALDVVASGDPTRRGALRSFAAAALGTFTAMGLANLARAEQSNSLRKRRKRHDKYKRDREQDAQPAETPEPPTPEPPASESVDPLVDAEAKKKGKPGPPGPAGSTGPEGPQGPQGPAGPTATTIVSAHDVVGPVFSHSVTVAAYCPAGNSLLGGGFDTGVSGERSSDVEVNYAIPKIPGGATSPHYEARFTRKGDFSPDGIVVKVYAVCTA